jgi:hypothetical protein
VVARFGEMDLARWWNTKGQLGKLGTFAVRRGLPRSHRFTQARSVFAVAAHRSTDVPLGSVTLWRLPGEIEEAFDARREQWLDGAAAWAPFFDDLGNTKPLRSLTEPLRVAKDNGGKRALIPIENKRSFLDVSADILEHVDPIFFGDPKTAALKVLGGT